MKKPQKLAIYTATLILLSLAAIALRFYLEKREEEQKSDMTVPAAAVTVSDGEEIDADGLSAGSTLLKSYGIEVTSGECFVRFTVQMLGSDGSSFNDKLEAKLEEIDEYEAMLDPDSASYLAFLQAYYSLQNEYFQLEAKAQLCFDTLCLELNQGEITESFSYSSSLLETLESQGKITFANSDEGSLFYKEYDEESPFTRTYYYSQRLSAGDTALLFSSIIIPKDWDTLTCELTYFQGYEDNTFQEETKEFTYIELLDEGFSINVSAEIVDADDFDSPLAAFNSAQTLAVTTLDSSSAD